jgi:hypothetical protein
MKRRYAAHKKKGGWHWTLRLTPRVKLTVERPGPDGEVIAVTALKIAPEQDLVRRPSYRRR